MRLTDRRRALMAASTDELNGLKPSTSVGLGRSIASVTPEGLLYISSWMAGPTNVIAPSFKRPIMIASGDAVTVKIVRISGTLSPQYSFADISLEDVPVISNASYNGTSNTALKQTATVTQNITASVIKINNRTQNPAGTDYKAEIQISINGTRVI